MLQHTAMMNTVIGNQPYSLPPYWSQQNVCRLGNEWWSLGALPLCPRCGDAVGAGERLGVAMSTIEVLDGRAG
jgi:hypothetical protein